MATSAGAGAEPGNGKTKTGRLDYVRDDRPAERSGIGGVVRLLAGSQRRTSGGHLKNYRGILQADGYAGFNRLYETGPHRRGRMLGACQAQVLRPVSGAAIPDRERGAGAHRAVIRNRERDPRPIAGGAKRSPASEITAAARSDACVAEGDAVEAVAEVGRGHGDPLCAGTLDCAPAVFVEDGRVEMDNNAAERALRAVALGRKNYLFAGSDAGGERAAAIYSLLGSAKLNGIDPEAYLSSVLRRIADHPIHRIAELLPWNLFPANPPATEAA